MDILGGLVVVMLTLFLQFCPTQNLKAGTVYCYQMVGTMRTATVKVEKLDAKKRTADFSAQFSPSLLDSDPRLRSASFSWTDKERTLVNLKAKDYTITEKPEKLTLKELLRGDQWSKDGSAKMTWKTREIKGCPGPLKVSGTRYKSGERLVDVYSSPEIGLVDFRMQEGPNAKAVEFELKELAVPKQ